MDTHAYMAGEFDMFGGLDGGQGSYLTQNNRYIAHYAPKYPHSTRALGQFGVDFIGVGVKSKKPFCLSISFKAPHGPLTPDPELDGIYDVTTWDFPGNYGEKGAEHLAPHIQTWRQWDNFFLLEGSDYQRQQRRYHQLIHGIDIAVGMIRDALDKEGVSENTVIIMTSDNGSFCGSHRLNGKCLTYEEGSHVPMIIYDPRHKCSGKGHRCQQITGNIDIHPTILDFGGVSIPLELDGTSMRVLLEKREEQIHDFLGLYNFWNSVPTQGQAVLKNGYKYIYYWYGDRGYSETEELYNLNEDSLEMKNLSKSFFFLVVMEEMRSIYDKQLEKMKGKILHNNNCEYYGVLFDRRIPFSQKTSEFELFMQNWLERIGWAGGEWLEDVIIDKRWTIGMNMEEKLKLGKNKPGHPDLYTYQKGIGK